MKARITEVEKMTDIERLIKIRFQDREYAEGFRYMPGQFVKLGVMGVGEAPISICTAQDGEPGLELCIRDAGRVTSAIHKLKVGNILWVRGPYGNGFPMDAYEGSDLLLVAGGLGIAPIRGVLQYALQNREKFGEISVLYGVRCYDLMLFRDDILDNFRNGDRRGVKLYLSYEDKEDEVCYGLECERDDRCTQGLVTKLFGMLDKPSDNTYAVLGGPPIMYKFTVMELEKLGFRPEQVYMTLERRMRCGVGQCGHCIVGTGKSIKYVCKDGPVFTLWDAINTKGMI
ncbi:cytochrome-c3 hydrogenase subunit gamma [Candidatus Bathyarchaeota archaeon]|nr:cytochrome-c3 hydrogenase subunit gamma [Candidatus Bathyarchaeota archaeon]